MSLLINFLEFLFQNIHNITNNYGISLIILSTIVNIILLPAYLPLEKWKARAQIKQKPMLDEIEEIKQYYFGHERYLYTQAIYRRYKYHPLQSLIMSLGLFIQIPFFIAAYNMLSHYGGFSGVSFLFINNLAAPDAISNIGNLKINIMPILMTLINFISTFLYTKESGKAGRNQLFIIAGVFLVVLYTSPAALVLYWTMNNIFALIKQVCHNKFEIIREAKPGIIIDTVYSYRKYLYWGTIAVFTFFALSYITFYDKGRNSGNTLVEISIIILFVIQIISFIKNFLNLKSTKIKVIKAIITFILFTAGTVLFLKLSRVLSIEGNVAKSNFKTILLIYFIGGSSTLLNYPYSKERVINKIRNKEENLSSKTIYYGGLSLILLSSFFWIPALVYLSMPGSFEFSLLKLIVNNLPGFFITGVLFTGIFIFSKGTIKKYLTIFIASISITFFLYGFIIPFDFGTLDGFVLTDTKGLDLNLSNFITELVLFAIIFITIRLLLSKYKKGLKIGVLALNFLLVGQVGFTTVTSYNSKSNNVLTNNLPDNIDNVMALSKDKQNIVVFMLDAFRGSYVDQIFNDMPELKERLDGFKWYPNTLSVSYYTNSSLPTLLGGWDFTPERLNKRNGETLFQKTAQAYDSLIEKTKKADYDLTLVDPALYHSFYGDYNSLKDRAHTMSNKELGGYWETLNGSGYNSDDSGKISSVLVSVALFRLVPSSLKGKIYRDGVWLNNYKTGYTHSRNNWALLDLLPELSNTESSSKTYKFINNGFTHRPYAMTDDGTLLQNGYPDPSSANGLGGKNPYYSAKWALIAIADWIDWLKKNEIYDNTKIILVSDHGNQYSLEYPTNYTNKEEAKSLNISLKDLNRLHPLLMVKDFNRSGSLEVDNRLMSNGDTYDIAFDTFDYSNNQERVLKSYRSATWRRKELEELDKYKIRDIYEVKDSIFDLRNWSRMDNSENP